MKNSHKEALILVDIQNDFVPGGALPAKGGDEVVSVANRLMEQFDLVVASQDWHPANHESFAANHPGRQPGEAINLHGLKQELWPVHCVQGSKGAEFVKELRTGRIERVFKKGIDPEIDSYSAFYDNGHRRSTGMEEYLEEQGVESVFIAGLTTDYCVKFTALDAVKAGFETHVVLDGCRAVNVKEGDEEAAMKEMKKASVEVLASEQIPSYPGR